MGFSVTLENAVIISLIIAIRSWLLFVVLFHRMLVSPFHFQRTSTSLCQRVCSSPPNQWQNTHTSASPERDVKLIGKLSSMQWNGPLYSTFQSFDLLMCIAANREGERLCSIYQNYLSKYFFWSGIVGAVFLWSILKCQTFNLPNFKHMLSWEISAMPFTVNLLRKYKYYLYGTNSQK